MIYITGDTNDAALLEDLTELLIKEKASSEDTLIIIDNSDAIKSERNNNIFSYSKLGPTVLFLDSDLDKPSELKKYPLIEKYGGMVHQISNNVFHLCRGEIFTIEERTFLVMGGYSSVEEPYRITGVNFSYDDVITREDMDRAYDNLERRDFKVDTILTHCPPGHLFKDFRLFPLADHNNDILQRLSMFADFNHWLFSNCCTDKAFDDVYRSVYADVISVTGKGEEPQLDVDGYFKRQLNKNFYRA